MSRLILPLLILIICVIGCTANNVSEKKFDVAIINNSTLPKTVETPPAINVTIKNVYKTINLSNTDFSEKGYTYLVVDMELVNPFLEYYVWPYLTDNVAVDDYYSLKPNIPGLIALDKISNGTYSGKIVFRVISNDSAEYTLVVQSDRKEMNYSIGKVPEPSKTAGLAGKLTIDAIDYMFDCYTYDATRNAVTNKTETLNTIRWFVNYTIENDGAVPFTAKEDFHNIENIATWICCSTHYLLPGKKKTASTSLNTFVKEGSNLINFRVLLSPNQGNDNITLMDSKNLTIKISGLLCDNKTYSIYR